MTSHSSFSNTSTVSFEETPRTFFSMMPNIVDDLLKNPHEFRLYMKYRRIAGEGGHCTKSNAHLAEECGMCERKIQDIKKSLASPRPELNGKSLIRINKRINEDKSNQTDEIIICDIWKENDIFYRTKRGGAPYAPGGVHVMHQGGAPHAPKEEPIKEDIDLSKDKSLARSNAKHSSKLVVSISFDKDKKRFVNISEQDLQLWKEAYPRINIQQELAQAASWVLSNPRKAKKNWRGFLQRWFQKNEDQAEIREAYQTINKLSPTKQPDSQKKIADEEAYVSEFIGKNPSSYKYLNPSKEGVQIKIENRWTPTLLYTENGFKDQFMSALRKGNHI